MADLGEMIADEAIARMTDDGLPLAEAAMVLIMAGIDCLSGCCVDCQSQAAELIRHRLAELQRAQLAVLH